MTGHCSDCGNTLCICPVPEVQDGRPSLIPDVMMMTCALARHKLYMSMHPSPVVVHIDRHGMTQQLDHPGINRAYKVIEWIEDLHRDEEPSPGAFPEPSDAPETVDHPQHYNSHPAGVECITVVEHFSFNTGNAIKYLWRAGLKPGTGAIEDLKKAAWYIQRETGRLQGKAT